MRRVFWDSNLFIYLFEENPRFVEVVRALRIRMAARGDVLYTGALTVGEILVKPFQEGDLRMVERYRTFFRNSSAVTVMPMDVVAAEHYAAIRADRGISHADAMQLACAASANVDLFITNDERLHGKEIDGIKFVTSLSRSPL